MVDMDTFVATLYVMVDDFCKAELPRETRPGPEPSEVVTLAVCSQWSRFRTQRDCYRFAQQMLRGASPTLPRRSQFNRAVRRQNKAIVAFF